MYKEILDILLEGVDGKSNIKENILKNQLAYHFKNKNTTNKNVLDNAVVIVRRILQNFTLNEIIGFQPITSDKNPTIVSGGQEFNQIVGTRILNITYPEIQSLDLGAYGDIDLESEINQACALEIETEITNEFLDLISKYATERDSGGRLVESIISAAREVSGNWVVISPTTLTVLAPSTVFQQNEVDVSSSSSGGGLLYVGMLDDTIKVYVSLYRVEDHILVGRKEIGNEDTAIIYAPSVMVEAGVRINRSDDVEAATPLLTSYANFINIPACSEQYRKILINH